MQGPYYQYANRLAHLHFLLQHDIPARLVFIYFCGDNWGGKTLSNGNPPNCPKEAQQWDAYLKDMHDRLRMNGQSKLEERVHSLFLPVYLRLPSCHEIQETLPQPRGERMSGIEKIATETLKKHLARWPKPTRVHPVRDAFVHEPPLISLETPNGQVSVRRNDIKAELRRRGENVE
jgi:hypothetical protein